MRSDLNKLLCERERYGSSKDFGEFRHSARAENIGLDRLADDEVTESTFSGERESMKKRYNIGWDKKELNENLNPLYGFIRKSVGRPWDKVYSELCKSFDKRSVINQHILDHLFQYVRVNTVLRDNKIYAIDKWGDEDPLDRTSARYYVHPKTGILLENRKRLSWKKMRRQRDADYQKRMLAVERKFDDGTKLENIEGIWYHVWTVVETVPAKQCYTTDGIPYTYREYQTSTTHKRQLSSKELKQYGITNTL
jgi:hypothetical protein